MAGRAKENFPGGGLEYLFVYLNVRIFKCSYRIFKATSGPPPAGTTGKMFVPLMIFLTLSNSKTNHK